MQVVERVRDAEVAGETLSQEVDMFSVQLFLVDQGAVEVVQGISHTYQL